MFAKMCFVFFGAHGLLLQGVLALREDHVIEMCCTARLGPKNLLQALFCVLSLLPAGGNGENCQGDFTC